MPFFTDFEAFVRYLWNRPAESRRAMMKFAGSISNMCAAKLARFTVQPLVSRRCCSYRNSIMKRVWYVTCSFRAAVSERKKGTEKLATNDCAKSFLSLAMGFFFSSSSSIISHWCRTRRSIDGERTNSPVRDGRSDATRFRSLEKPISQKMTCPNKSKPRRPARPLIWRYMRPLRSTESPQKTVVRHGMLMPSASVPVAKTTLR
mmetsp:Transcript_71697/g.202403  ORF Transcript_71697/g.202403 Transcript_71697/m.202403 type:complete len:204 (-) Transcript_71697:1978-2589(-)